MAIVYVFGVLSGVLLLIIALAGWIAVAAGTLKERTAHRGEASTP